MTTLYEYYNTGDDASSAIYGANWNAQSFTVGANPHTVKSVKLKMYRLGSPGTLTVSIRATDADGHPTGPDLTVGTIDANTFTTSSPGEFYEITLPEYSLSQTTKYAIVCRALTGDALNCVIWRHDQTSPTYADGCAEYSVNSGDSWVSYTGRDFMFEVWGVSLPSGCSGFNFFTNGILLTLSATGAWVDMDASPYIPAGSTGVIVKILTVSGLAFRGAVRKNGSTDEFYETVDLHYLRYAVIGVDANRIFEAIGHATYTKIYLMGYTDENVVLFTDAVDKTPSVTGSWEDVDASANIPVGSTGVVCHIVNSSSDTEYSGGIRKNGSGDTFPYGYLGASNRYVYQIVGVDTNRIFEAKIESTSVKIKLQGYTKKPVTLFTNGLDKSLAVTDAWTDVDVTAWTDPDADGAILFVKNAAFVTLRGDVRKNGSTDDHTTDATLALTECRGAFIGLDSDQLFEGWINSTYVDFYLIGYCKPRRLPVLGLTGNMTF